MITDKPMTRRRFLVVCGCTAAALLSGCINDERTLSVIENDQTQAEQTTQATLEAQPIPTATPMATPAVATAAPTRVTTRCPKGKINDPYPGHCRLYTDRNSNNICDYSEVG